MRSILHYSTHLCVLNVQFTLFSSEKTAAEAKKILEIKTELSKLDSELAADVAILRKEIEAASLEFLDVQ